MLLHTIVLSTGGFGHWEKSARTKRVSTERLSMIRAISGIFLRNYCIRCPKIREFRPIHGYPFCGYLLGPYREKKPGLNIVTTPERRCPHLCSWILVEDSISDILPSSG